MVLLQEKIHRKISKGVRNIFDTLENNGMKFIMERAKKGISRLLNYGVDINPACRLW